MNLVSKLCILRLFAANCRVHGEKEEKMWDIPPSTPGFILFYAYENYIVHEFLIPIFRSSGSNNTRRAVSHSLERNDVITRREHDQNAKRNGTHKAYEKDINIHYRENYRFVIAIITSQYFCLEAFSAEAVSMLLKLYRLLALWYGMMHSTRQRWN